MSIDTVKIFDTTLRDGEQAPGFSMTSGQKLRMAEALEALKVDVMEAGFAAALKVISTRLKQLPKRLKTAQFVRWRVVMMVIFAPLERRLNPRIAGVSIPLSPHHLCTANLN